MRPESEPNGTTGIRHPTGANWRVWSLAAREEQCLGMETENSGRIPLTHLGGMQRNTTRDRPIEIQRSLRMTSRSLLLIMTVANTPANTRAAMGSQKSSATNIASASTTRLTTFAPCRLAIPLLAYSRQG